MCISSWSGPGWRAPACWNAHSSDLELSSDDLLFQCIMAVGSSYPMWNYTSIHHVGTVAESFIWTNRILRPEEYFESLPWLWCITSQQEFFRYDYAPNQLIMNWLRDFAEWNWPNQVALKREKIQLLSGSISPGGLEESKQLCCELPMVGSWVWGYVARTWECSLGAVSKPCLAASKKRGTSVL